MNFCLEPMLDRNREIKENNRLKNWRKNKSRGN